MPVSGSDLLAYGEQFIGTPYVWGGNSLTSGVDCSGLVQQVMAHFGIKVPRVSYDQIGVGQAVSIDKLQPGDLVFFANPGNTGQASHVAIYAGNGQMLEAPRPGEKVRLTSFTQDYYASRFIGARRMNGVTNSAGQGSYAITDTNGTSAKLDPQELAAEYGFAYSFLQSNPELKNLFAEMVANNWNQAKFTAELHNTKWWKDNSDSAKQLLQEQQTDPANYNAKLTAATVQIQQLAAEMGAAVPSSKLGSIAKTALMTNMDDGQLRNMLGTYITFTDKGTMNGAAGAFQHQMSQYASDMGVTLSDQALKNQAQLIARGLMTQDDAMESIRQTAASTFPAYAQQINAGVTMKDIAQPYAQVASQLLELPDSNFTVANPIVRNALNYIDPSTGTPTGMGLSQFEQSIKQSPQWLKTQNAQDSLMGIGRSVLQQMGIAT